MNMVSYDPDKLNKFYVAVELREPSNGRFYWIVSGYDSMSVNGDHDDLWNAIVAYFNNESEYVAEIREATDEEVEKYDGHSMLFVIDVTM